MNGLEEIQKTIGNFAEKSKQTKQQIAQIEKKRAHLAHERNEMKKHNAASWSVEIDVLGNQITELGNQSQELQNKLDAKYIEVKKVVNLMVDNQVAENIRKINKLDEEIQELKDNISEQEKIRAKYEAQKQDFYERFGRIPELSEKAVEEEKIQEQKCEQAKGEIECVQEIIEGIKKEISSFINVKEDFRNKNWSNYINEEVEVLPFSVEEAEVEEFEPIEELMVEKVEPLEELIDTLTVELKARHIRRLREGKCTIELGFAHSDILNNLERVSDHCSNIAVDVIQSDKENFDTHEYLDAMKNRDNQQFAREYKEYKEKYRLPETRKFV